MESTEEAKADSGFNPVQASKEQIKVMGCNQPGSRPAPIPSIVILVGGIVIYIVLMIGSSVFLHRQVTTELLLIIGWLVLEALSYQNAYCHEAIGRSVVMALMLAAVIASVLSLYFYLQYYQVVLSGGGKQRICVWDDSTDHGWCMYDSVFDSVPNMQIGET